MCVKERESERINSYREQTFRSVDPTLLVLRHPRPHVVFGPLDSGCSYFAHLQSTFSTTRTAAVIVTGYMCVYFAEVAAESRE